MLQIDAIMTLLQKIYVAVGCIMFLLGTGGTVALGIYVYSDCEGSCVSFKVLLAFFTTAVLLISAFIVRSAWRIYRVRNSPQYMPLLSEEKHEEHVYMV